MVCGEDRTRPAPHIARAGRAGPGGSGARRAGPAPLPAKGEASYIGLDLGKLTGTDSGL